MRTGEIDPSILLLCLEEKLFHFRNNPKRSQQFCPSELSEV